MIDVALARRLLRLCPSTGHLFWRNPTGRLPAGTRAGCASHRGYRKVRVANRLYYEHRVVFALAHGRDPGPRCVDHINGDRSDNRPANLQLATNSENVRKRHRLSINNTSGSLGVSWRKRTSRWEAYIKFDGQRRHLGLFRSLPAARRARRKAERDLFGRFAPTV